MFPLKQNPFNFKVTEKRWLKQPKTTMSTVKLNLLATLLRESQRIIFEQRRKQGGTGHIPILEDIKLDSEAKMKEIFKGNACLEAAELFPIYIALMRWF